jgi:hypothetical protein
MTVRHLKIYCTFVISHVQIFSLVLDHGRFEKSEIKNLLIILSF